MRSGLERMYGTGGADGSGENVIFYITVYNEPVSQPAEPEDVDVDGILKGIHRIGVAEGDGPRVRLLASGVAVPWIVDAARMLREEWGVAADTWSVTSWNELARDAVAAEEWSLLHPSETARTPYVTEKLSGSNGPSSRSPTTCGRCRCRSRAGCRRTTGCWAPRGSASPTPGPPRDASSTSTPSRSSCRRCRRSPTPARSTQPWSRRRSPQYRIDDPTAVAGVLQEGGDA